MTNAIQALHAAISRRDWHATEVAANELRDAPASPNRFSGWLIESGAGTYWAGRAPDDFEPDHNDAVRFARQDDAERVRCWLIERSNAPLSKACRASEHVWMS